jgi:2-oxoglutarate dehydrogenase E1 component
VLPVLIHGDAAFIGQGVLMETLNLSQTRGYGTGGTVHIVVNNQIGFTTSDPRDTRSTLYCTDVAKMIEAPIFHVNGDDPEACAASRRGRDGVPAEFQKDVVVDLVCFRKLGHNEQDEPMVTQPLMYKKIAAASRHPQALRRPPGQSEGVIGEGEADQLVATYREAMDAGPAHRTRRSLQLQAAVRGRLDAVHAGRPRGRSPRHADAARRAARSRRRSLTRFRRTSSCIPRVEKVIADRKAMGDGKLPLDWGMAENLAYATLLNEGYGVRLSGQDVGRGTFFHRHAVLHDQNREKLGLRHLHAAAAHQGEPACDSR